MRIHISKSDLTRWSDAQLACAHVLLLTKVGMYKDQSPPIGIGGHMVVDVVDLGLDSPLRVANALLPLGDLIDDVWTDEGDVEGTDNRVMAT